MHEGIRRLLSQAGKSWSAGPRVTSADIIKAESELGFSFPEDYREYLMLGGLVSGGQAVRGLWPLKDVVSLNRDMPIFKWFKQIVGIGNEGFTVYGFDYREGEPRVVSLAWSMSDWADVTIEADTFEAFLIQSL